MLSDTTEKSQNVCELLTMYPDLSTTKEGVVQSTTQVHGMWNEVQKIRPQSLNQTINNVTKSVKNQRTEPKHTQIANNDQYAHPPSFPLSHQ